MKNNLEKRLVDKGVQTDYVVIGFAISMSAWTKLEVFNPTTMSFKEYSEVLEQYFIIDDITPAKRKPILFLKLEKWVREYVISKGLDHESKTYEGVKAVLIERYDRARVRNENRIKARNYKIELDNLYASILEYIDYVKKSTVVSDYEGLKDIIKEKLIDKLGFNSWITQRLNDRFDCYGTYEELAANIDDFWRNHRRIRRGGDRREQGSQELNMEIRNKANVRCYACGSMGHYASECRNRLEIPKEQEVKREVSAITTANSSTGINTIREDNRGIDLIILPIEVSGMEVFALVDTGSVVNLLSKNKFEEICRRNKKEVILNKYDRILVGAFGQKVTAEEICILKIKYENHLINTTVVVAEKLNNYEMLMGIDLVKRLGLLNLPRELMPKCDLEEMRCKGVNLVTSTQVLSNEEVVKRVKRNFEQIEEVISKNSDDLGVFIDKVPKISWRKEEERTFFPYKYPVHLWNIGKKLLDDMLAQDIIEFGSAKYLHNVIIIRKHGDVIKDAEDINKLYRTVVDLRATNRMAEKQDYGNVLLDDFVLLKENYNYFCSLDLTQCFHQFILCEEYKTYFGISFPGMQPMRYKRLPMGFVNSPAILHQLLESRIPPTVIRFYYDDGLKGTVGDIEQHLKNMEEIFRHLYKASLKINLSKSILCSDNIGILGGQIKI